MPSSTAESVREETQRAELQSALQSDLFTRSPALAHLLSYLCEKTFAGESGQIKEYSIALEVFGRPESFDQDSDSIVRVQANRLRKRLAEYYSGEGKLHPVRITIPVGQYVPLFEEHAPQETSLPAEGLSPDSRSSQPLPSARGEFRPRQKVLLSLAALAVLALAAVIAILVRPKPTSRAVTSTPVTSPVSVTPTVTEPAVGLPVGEEVRILAGSSRSYVDRSGKAWSPDAYFRGGTPVRSTVQHIWRTQDPSIYRTSRQGDFSYDIPLKPGMYELHLHFAETFYGPEDVGGGGESSRVMTVSANGKPLLSDFDALADAEGGRTAVVKVFTDIVPASEGFLHLAFSSVNGGRAMISAIEILPGARGHVRPVRIVAREVPYYSNDSHWWSSDIYFKGGRLAASEEPAAGTDDPELYETDRWGRFSYAIPVTPGKYTVILHFIERGLDAANRGVSSPEQTYAEAPSGRIFNVFCNGEAIVRNLNIQKEAGENRPLVRTVTGLRPNAQGELLLDFVPVNHYATISAIEVVPE